MASAPVLPGRQVPDQVLPAAVPWADGQHRACPGAGQTGTQGLPGHRALEAVRPAWVLAACPLRVAARDARPSAAHPDPSGPGAEAARTRKPTGKATSPHYRVRRRSRRPLQHQRVRMWSVGGADGLAL